MLVYGALMSGQFDLAAQYSTPMADIGKYANITNAFWPPPAFLVWARVGAWGNILAQPLGDVGSEWPEYFKVCGDVVDYQVVSGRVVPSACKSLLVKKGVVYGLWSDV
jgi:hypothetical protein